MIKIGVSLKRHCICTADGRRMIVFPAKARVGKKILPLQECRGVRSSKVDIYLKRCIFPRRLDLTPELEEGITEFLGVYSIRGDPFDCYAFVNLVFDIRPHPTSHLLRFWEMSPLAELPKPGQPVFFVTNEKNIFHHAAVHLQDGIYISVYGYDGDLEFSTLEDMKRDYGAADVVTASPRTERLPIF